MPKKFQVGSGNKVKLFVALLPLGSRTPPVNVEVETSSSGIAAAATTITVSALTAPIAGGTPLKFINGSNSELLVVLKEDALQGATILKIEPATAALTGASTADYVAKLRLLGGTKMTVDIKADRVDSVVYEDELGYSDGVITKQSWSLPWTANLLADDEAYRRIFYAASHGTSQREVYVWQQDPPPSGYTIGDGLQGATVVTNFQKDLPSDNIITFQCTFEGQGSPLLTRYS